MAGGDDPAQSAGAEHAAWQALELGGHALLKRVALGRGQGPPPKTVALVEWDSVDDAMAFYKSKAWTELAPERDNAQKTSRRYIVDIEK